MPSNEEGLRRVRLDWREGRAAFDAPAADRWARLLYRGAVRVNGTRLPPRAADVAVDSTALTPYLRAGRNIIEIESSAMPEIETSPRVYAIARRVGGRLAVAVENTLDNAANVEIEAAGETKPAYVPPESTVELDFPAPGGPAVLRFYKFPEAVEEGYEYQWRIP
ncbi:MAG: hypothetical protein SFV18_00855 [Bryobacteraceae bacterium]|nr:hypothetical protein [Bryobacteraceae bacterium]